MWIMNDCELRNEKGHMRFDEPDPLLKGSAFIKKGSGCLFHGKGIFLDEPAPDRIPLEPVHQGSHSSPMQHRPGDKHHHAAFFPGILQVVYPLAQLYEFLHDASSPT